MPSRRALLVGGFAGLAAVSTSLLRGFVGSPGVDGAEPELAPGEETTITVTAHNVGSLILSLPHSRERVRIDVNDASVSPSPTSQEDSYPPYWNWWRPRQTVEVVVPVSVAADAEPGTVRYGVTVWNRSDREAADSISEEFAITVRDT
ncbi:hypothetical protein ACFO5R_16090 [Halosolutus amylolyticus]|uniref:DUF11 domain-containing protein n=1 Tax=Halosolutus amylolyticus TaxID=2932267 RepID=A0ABD5PS77_9EURY|nr:hypothetical protein [Halosolutus amylolyticus]